MKKAYWYIAVLFLAIIIVDRLALPKGIGYAVSVALGCMIGAILLNVIKNRKKK